jgi:hypothetical protein
MENPTLTQEHQQLRTLLEQYSGTATALPDLKVGEYRGWGAPLREWLQQVVAAFWEWLKALLGPLPTAPVALDWPVVLRGLWWTGVAVLVFWLTYTLARKYLLSKRPPGAQAGLLTAVAGAEEQLEKQVGAAVQGESWGLAARLRWRLFLYRMRCQPDVTPGEFFATPQYRQRWEQRHGTPVAEQYRVMFAATDGSQQWFTHYHGGLTDLEGEYRHA